MMPENKADMPAEIPTFDSPKVAKARLPLPLSLRGMKSFFVSSGDIFNDHLVTFSMIAEESFIEEW